MVSVDKALCGKVDYGLFFGSLGSAMKYHDLSDHDAEAEFVIRSTDVDAASKLLGTAAESEGFVLTRRNGRFVINWGPKNLLHVDIWFLTEEGNCAVVQQSDFYVMQLPGSWLAPNSLGAARCQFRGQAFPCPQNPDRVLKVIKPLLHSEQGAQDASGHGDNGESAGQPQPDCDGVSSCCGLIQRIPSDSNSA
jgi:hypothetical protein